jgi:hypothetical protein
MIELKFLYEGCHRPGNTTSNTILTQVGRETNTSINICFQQVMSSQTVDQGW